MHLNATWSQLEGRKGNFWVADHFNHTDEPGKVLTSIWGNVEAAGKYVFRGYSTPTQWDPG